MQTKNTKNCSVGQKVYVGIDALHLKNWTVTVALENTVFNPFSQDPSTQTLGKYLRKNFPDGIY